MSIKARIAAAAIALVTTGAGAAAASAATVTVTVDDGATQVPLANGSTTPLRNMKADLNVTPAAGERYKLTVTGPGGQVAASVDCLSVAASDGLDYVGNGTYTGTLQTYATSSCSGTATATASFSIVVNAGVTINVPSPTKVLTRDPGGSYITHQIPVGLNPGALSTQVHYARNGVLGPDGGITGTSERDYVDVATGASTISFFQPGTYLLVAHAESFTTGVFTPWSSPVTVQAYAPFDFSGPVAFPDSRGPIYTLRAMLRDKGGRGKVKVLIAHGWKGGTFRSLGKARIRGRVIKKTFTEHQIGKFRIRYVYKGGELIAPGTVTQKVKIRRSFF